MIKNHWPVLFTILIVIISIVLGVAASHSTDTGAVIMMGVIIFMFLLPLAGAVLGGWYGWKSRSPLKWLLAPAVYLGISLFMIVEDLLFSDGMADFGGYWSIGLFAGIACLAVEAATSAIAWLARRNRKD